MPRRTFSRFHTDKPDKGGKSYRPSRWNGSELIGCRDTSIGPIFLLVTQRCSAHEIRRMEAVMKILHLDSSITGQHSVSRILTAEIVAAEVAQNPGAEVIYHDLANEPAMHLSPAHLAAFQGATVESEALGWDLALGAKYIDELIAADVLVIG